MVTNICGVWGAKAGLQVSWREFHIHIHLDYDRVEFLSCIIFFLKKNHDLKLHFNLENYLFFSWKMRYYFYQVHLHLKIMLIFICLFIFEKKNIYLIQVHLIEHRPMDVYNFLKSKKISFICHLYLISIN